MAKVLVHAAAATAGGGRTYIKNVLPLLPRIGGDHEWHVLLPQAQRAEFSALEGKLHLFSHPEAEAGGWRRVRFDQSSVARKLRSERFDAFVATGNFGLLRPPVPQILYNRNPLYFSEHHCVELKRRRLYRDWAVIRMRRAMALASIRASTMNVVPTGAFANHISRFGRIDRSTFRTIHHGFDRARFTAGGEELAPGLRDQLVGPPDTARVLFVSHYNYFRNFETVLRALPHLTRRLAPRPLQLVLTTRLAEGLFEHKYDTTAAARLVRELGIEPNVVMLGHVPYESLYALYRACDVAVCPSYAETFGHPMVEAMAAGLPVVATDMDIHREVCGSAGHYFDVFDPEDLAARLHDVLADGDLYERLSTAAARESARYNWERNVTELVSLIEQVVRDNHRQNGRLQQAAAPDQHVPRDASPA